MSDWTKHRWLRWSTMCLWCVWVGMTLGCSATSPTPTQNSSDMVTDSDESEERRRAKLRLELASNYFSQGQTTVALDEIKQALRVDPNFADSYNLRGLIYMRLNNDSLAEGSFKRALELSPNNPDVLHNYGWLRCLQQRYDEADKLFVQALGQPQYMDKSRTYMTQGMCFVRVGRTVQAEESFRRSYELDPAHPVTGYNLSLLLFQRGEYERAQFYIRRLNNGEFANAESLWLGIKVERRMKDRVAMRQLVDQLKKQFPDSKELSAFERGAFDE